MRAPMNVKFDVVHCRVGLLNFFQTREAANIQKLVTFDISGPAAVVDIK